jgi:hypothetical protein
MTDVRWNQSSARGLAFKIPFCSKATHWRPATAGECCSFVRITAHRPMCGKYVAKPYQDGVLVYPAAADIDANAVMNFITMGTPVCAGAGWVGPMATFPYPASAPNPITAYPNKVGARGGNDCFLNGGWGRSSHDYFSRGNGRRRRSVNDPFTHHAAT